MAIDPFSLMCELRKEIIENQKTRAQMINIKLTVVSGLVAAGGIAFANDFESAVISGHELLCILLSAGALMAFLFDYLINSYSNSIRRQGQYIRKYLEPNMAIEIKTGDKDFKLWEEHLYDEVYTKPTMPKAVIGNLGITCTAFLLAFTALITRFWPNPWWIAAALLIIILVYLDCSNFIKTNNKYNKPKT